MRIINSLIGLLPSHSRWLGTHDNSLLAEKVKRHAAGAVAAEAIAGALVELPGRSAANLADPRVRAVLCISPQGPGPSGFTERSFGQLV